MNRRIILFLALTILLISIGCSASQCSFEDSRFLTFWSFTSDNLQMDYIELSLYANSENLVLMSLRTEFKLFGVRQYIRFWIDCSNASNPRHWGNCTIRIKGTYSDSNGSRIYSDLYNRSVSITPENRAPFGIERIEYFHNFTEEILRIKQQVYPDKDVEHFGIYGSVTLETEIHDVIGLMENKRYLKLSLHTSAASHFPWNFFQIIRIPEGATWTKAKIDDEDMEETLPNQHEATFTVLPTKETNQQIYAAWELPVSVPLLMTYPYNIFIGAAIALVVGWFGRFTYDKVAEWRNSQSGQNKGDNGGTLGKRTAKMPLLTRALFPIIGILAGLCYILAPMFVYLAPEHTLTLVNGTITVVLVIITALHMLEARRTRLESVRPSFSLQPSEYYIGGGFGFLHLVNTGGVARQIKIDAVHKEKKRLLFISSIGNSERVPVLAGKFPSAGGVAEVKIEYFDSYGLKHQEKLSIDFNELLTARREFAYILSPLDLIVRRLDDIERQLRDIERALSNLKR